MASALHEIGCLPDGNPVACRHLQLRHAQRSPRSSIEIKDMITVFLNNKKPPCRRAVSFATA